MKRILFLAVIFTLASSSFRQAKAGGEVSVDFFYDNLGSEGSWVELGDYGYCWQPAVAVSNAHWRPYADGYWAFTDVGWTWISNEEFGWATYHYGRWARIHDRGWFWVPGREWGPAWVSWRTGGDYVGWAPLPPRGRDEEQYDGNPITAQVDVEFDIGPAYYNFVDVRYIGEPVLRERIFEPSLNITYVNQTVNVTNITYVNSTVYNYGPDYDRLNRYSTRPVRRMTLERDTNVDLTAGIRPNGLTKVQGDKLIIAAPSTIQKPANPVAPKAVKERIDKSKLEQGWGGISDPKAQAELKQKMKSEDPKNVLPPSVKPNVNPQAVQPPANVSPVPPAPTKPAQPIFQASPDSRSKPSSPFVGTTPAKQATPSDNRPKQPLPPERMTPPARLENPPDAKSKQPLPPERMTPPARRDIPPDAMAKQPPQVERKPPEQFPHDVRPKPAQQPERMSPPERMTPPNSAPKQPAPPERMMPPGQTSSDLQPRRTLPPDRMAPPKRDVPSDNPPTRMMPPKREVPSQIPPEHAAPPNGPRPDVPHSKRPPEKKEIPPSPAPGS